MKRFFFSQGMLDSMVEAGKIRVDKGILTMLADGHPTFALLPAYRFVKTIDDGADPAGLVGQVRSEQELRELGAEVYLDSVIYRDVAYLAEPGFIAERQSPAGPAGENAATRTAATAEASTEKPSDEDLLSRFLLDDLLK
jgi:hypothetical protein